MPSIDPFACRINRKVSRYVSWRPDPEAQFVDAFSCSWSQEQFYAFPPFRLILRCLKKIEIEDGEGIIIVPVWPSSSSSSSILYLPSDFRVALTANISEHFNSTMGKDHTTTLGTSCPALYDECVGSLTSPADHNSEDAGDGVYGLSSLSEKTRISNHLQMSLQRQHILLSYFKTLNVGPVWGSNPRSPAR